MTNEKMTSRLDGFLITLAFFLAGLRALIFFSLSPDVSVLVGQAWIEILLWGLVTVGMIYVLARENLLKSYIKAWQRNWLVGLFIGLAFVSVFWSVSPGATLFRASELLFAALFGAYVGVRFLPERSTDLLFWFGVIVFILSIALALGAPPTGTMYWRPFNGAWRGIYWHRNHLASMAALLSVVHFCRAWVAFQARNNKGVLDIFFYLVSLMILFFAKSATGYILFLTLHLFVAAVLIWLRISHRLQKQHYILALLLAGLGAVLLLFNLDFVFGLFNRSTTLSGRASLWINLLQIAYERFWFGHGFGALWTLDSFREQIMQLAGWAAQPLIGDNGLLDIYLHLGVTGVLLFSGILLLATVRAFRHAMTHKTLMSFIPLLIMAYVFVANITFSLFAETEVFVWLWIVAVLFMSLPSSRSPSGESLG